jgi:hypothetical protein
MSSVTGIKGYVKKGTIWKKTSETFNVFGLKRATAHYILVVSLRWMKMGQLIQEILRGDFAFQL